MHPSLAGPDNFCCVGGSIGIDSTTFFFFFFLVRWGYGLVNNYQRGAINTMICVENSVVTTALGMCISAEILAERQVVILKQ